MNTHDDDTGPAPAVTAAEAALKRAWRDASNDEPPTDLDAKILAAAGTPGARADTHVADSASARAAPNRTPSRTARAYRRWQPLAVAASVAALAFVLLPTLQRQSTVSVPARIEPLEESKTVVPGEVRLTPVTPEATTQSQVTDAASPSSPATNELSLIRGEAAASAPASAPASPVAAPPPALAPAPGAARVAVPAAAAAASSAEGQVSGGRPPVRDMFEDRALTEEEAARPAGPLLVPPPSDQPVPVNRGMAERTAPAAPAKQSADAQLRPDPQAWAARIAALHDAGDLEGAATSLRNFRAAYDKADEYLPSALRAWARTIQ